MSNTTNAVRMFLIKAASAAMFALVAVGAWGQDTTTTTIRHGERSYDTQVKNAEVAYVEGNDLVLRLENGRLEHLVVPASDVFTINGKDVSVYDLVPGTKLTQTITTSTAPRYVTTIQTVKGKIWHVNPPNTVILTLPDHTNRTYTIPNHAKFNGERKSVFELRKGMTLEATIVTDDEHTVMEQTKTTVGEMPIPDAPREIGMLLFSHPRLHPAPPAVMTASLDELEAAPAALPKTGSLLPLAGLLGALGVSTALGLGAARRAFVKDVTRG